MARVIGYEGQRDPRALVSWGSAALVKDDTLINASTRVRMKFTSKDVASFAKNGSISPLTEPLEIADAATDDALVVVEISRSKWDSILLVDPGRIGDLIAKKGFTKTHVYVFRNTASFDLYRKEVVDRVLNEILYKEPDRKSGDTLVRTGLILDAHHPALNATKVIRSANPTIAKGIAEANMRSDLDRARFQSIYSALASKEEDYTLKYDKGMADGGGMDVDKVVFVIGAVKTVGQQLSRLIEKDYAFLERPPPTRLWEMKAASATFTFKSKRKNQSLGEKVARYLELNLLQEAIGGKDVAGLEDAKPFQEALKKIVSPDETTIVEHSKKIGQKGLQRVGAQQVERPVAQAKWSDPLTLLGFQEGLIGEGRTIEVNFFPGVALNLSSTDNGDGGVPEGLSFLKERADFLFQPALYTIQRELVAAGSERFFLQKVVELKAGDHGVITAMPSSVVTGGYVYGVEIKVARAANGSLRLAIGTLDRVDASSMPLAQGWMKGYAALCYEAELADHRPARLAPAKFPAASPLVRLLEAVDSLGSPAPQTAVVAKINELFMLASSVRTNNTRREVLRRPDLLEFTGPLEKDIALTPAGVRYLGAYRAVERRRVVTRKPSKDE